MDNLTAGLRFLSFSMFLVDFKNILPLWWMVLWKQKIHHRGGGGLEVSHMTVEERNKFKGQTFQ